MARFLILHGWQGSSLEHWQTWLARRLRPEVTYPSLPEPDLPHLGPWLATLRSELERAAEPPVVLCHSLGCVLWLHHAATRPFDGPRAERVLLVAPPCSCADVPEIAPFFPVPLDAEAVRAAASGETRFVSSDADPYCPEGARRAYAERLGLPVDVVPGGGHLNADAGFGPWPAVEAWALGQRPAVASAAESGAASAAGSGAKNGVET